MLQRAGWVGGRSRESQTDRLDQAQAQAQARGPWLKQSGVSEIEGSVLEFSAASKLSGWQL